MSDAKQGKVVSKKAVRSEDKKLERRNSNSFVTEEKDGEATRGPPDYMLGPPNEKIVNIFRNVRRYALRSKKRLLSSELLVGKPATKAMKTSSNTTGVVASPSGGVGDDGDKKPSGRAVEVWPGTGMKVTLSSSPSTEGSKIVYSDSGSAHDPHSDEEKEEDSVSDEASEDTGITLGTNDTDEVKKAHKLAQQAYRKAHRAKPILGRPIFMEDIKAANPIRVSVAVRQAINKDDEGKMPAVSPIRTTGRVAVKEEEPEEPRRTYPSRVRVVRGLYNPGLMTTKASMWVDRPITRTRQVPIKMESDDEDHMEEEDAKPAAMESDDDEDIADDEDMEDAEGGLPEPLVPVEAVARMPTENNSDVPTEVTVRKHGEGDDDEVVTVPVNGTGIKNVSDAQREEIDGLEEDAAIIKEALGCTQDTLGLVAFRRKNAIKASIRDTVLNYVDDSLDFKSLVSLVQEKFAKVVNNPEGFGGEEVMKEIMAETIDDWELVKRIAQHVSSIYEENIVLATAVDDLVQRGLCGLGEAVCTEVKKNEAKKKKVNQDHDDGDDDEQSAAY